MKDKNNSNFFSTTDIDIEEMLKVATVHRNLLDKIESELQDDLEQLNAIVEFLQIIKDAESVELTKAEIENYEASDQCRIRKDEKLRFNYYERMRRFTLFLDSVTVFCAVDENEDVQENFCKVYCPYYKNCNKILV